MSQWTNNLNEPQTPAGSGTALGREPPDEPGTKRHVWTTPSKQGRFGMLRRGRVRSCVDDPVEARAIWYVRRGRVRSCVRPTLRGLMTAGPDAIRSLAPKQIYALEPRITLDGFFQAPGSTGSHHATIALTHPSAVAAADRGSFGFRLRHLGLLPASDRFLHVRAKPIRSAPFC